MRGIDIVTATSNGQRDAPSRATGKSYVIGVDSGGTFTDAVVIGDDGVVAMGKALTTDRRSTGVLDAIRAAVGELDSRVLRSARVISHGTTAGINTLLTFTGARVGLLMTSGFEDTIPIARGDKTQGVSAEVFSRPILWEKPPLLMPRSCIRGVTERIDAHGDVVVELDEAHAVRAIEALRHQGVEAVGICLLWAIRNDTHERRLAELVREHMPGVPICLSSEIAPRIGEYERALTVMLNSYITPKVSNYLLDLDDRLRDEGFDGELLIMHSAGGVQRVESLAARPINTLKSGPVGGLSASIKLGELLGHRNVICTDAGGTSFEVGLVVDGQAQYAARPMIGRYTLATAMADIESIGTGGGSIVWIDPDTRSLRVGPQSAAANPGPACYGRGGTTPTVTDAAVVLGYIEQLGRDLRVDVGAAEAAVATVGEPLGLSVVAAAEGILDIANTQIADLIRRVTVQRGHDTRDFALYAFGGAAPQYAGRYAAEIDVAEVIVPAAAAVFSAYGAVASDAHATVTTDAPQPFPPSASWVASEFEMLEARLSTELGGESERLVKKRYLRLRFRRQVHELRVPVPDFLSDGDMAAVAASFLGLYEQEFGPGSSTAISAIELVGPGIDAFLPLGQPRPRFGNQGDSGSVGVRRAWFAGTWADCPVHTLKTVGEGETVHGPAFIDLVTTTTVIYPGQSATVDALGNIRLTVHRRA
jgi:N-methylhydantoinase A